MKIGFGGIFQISQNRKKFQINQRYISMYISKGTSWTVDGGLKSQRTVRLVQTSDRPLPTPSRPFSKFNGIPGPGPRAHDRQARLRSHRLGGPGDRGRLATALRGLARGTSVHRSRRRISAVSRPIWTIESSNVLATVYVGFPAHSLSSLASRLASTTLEIQQNFQRNLNGIVNEIFNGRRIRRRGTPREQPTTPRARRAARRATARAAARSTTRAQSALCLAPPAIVGGAPVFGGGGGGL